MSADRFCVEVADARDRAGATVAELADAERLLPLPDAAFPAEVTVVRTVAANALVSLWGNRYSVPPGLVGGHVQIRWRLGAATIDLSAAGAVVATHPHARTAGRAAHRAPATAFSRSRARCASRSRLRSPPSFPPDSSATSSAGSTPMRCR